MSLSAYKTFIDGAMLVIMNQMDKATKICDRLYLGTEWNASNWDELKENGCAATYVITQLLQRRLHHQRDV